MCPAQVRSIGKRDAAFLFQLGDELIIYTPLHELLAASVPAFLPINIAEVRCSPGETKPSARASCMAQLCAFTPCAAWSAAGAVKCASGS